MSKALYRKYRSKSLDEIVGQSHITDVLSRSLEKGFVAHAYLFTGPRGVGKTSVARILAHKINKLNYTETSNHLDIIEIDAASNNGVEDVRDLRDKIQIAPTSASKKVYIIDEVHMLSKAAFNALLKTLEEPPEHAVFILATTNAEKLPATIISRTQKFSFRSISPMDAAKHLRFIADKEGIKIEDSAIELIAMRGDGSFRDSISLLDQLRSLTGEDTITRALIEASLGLAPTEYVSKILTAYETKDLKTIVDTLDETEKLGIQPTILADQIIQEVKNCIISKPNLIPLLDSLLEVAKSSAPNIKLLTVLASYPTKAKNMALSSPQATISAPVSALRSSMPKVDSKKVDNSLQEKPDFKDTNNANSVKEKNETDANTKSKIEDDKKDRTKNVASPPAKKVDWNNLLEHTRTNHVALYSVLSKCGHIQDGSILTLYTGTVFHKKKLDDSKYRMYLLESLEKIGIENIEVETIGTPMPPKDEVAASVVALMGGGKEVEATI